eukprot:6008647-Pyramimonas_sp.AAC.1
MTPSAVEACGFSALASATLVSPSNYTCRGGTGSSVIDFFGLNDPCMRAFKAVSVDKKWTVRPHRPVILELA